MGLEAKGRSMLGWIVSFTVIITIAIVGRFWSAALTGRRFQLDDALLLVAYVSTIVLEGVALWGLVNGLGNPMESLTPDELKIQFQVLLASSIVWITATTFIKLAILGLYQRIFDTRKFKLSARILMVITACYGLSFLVVFVTHCLPVDHLWNPSPTGQCRELQHEEIASGSINIALDTAVVILPMPWLWKLRMPTTNKIFLTFLFTLGAITISVMCVRLWETVNPNPDPIIAIADIGLLSSLELWIGIIVACAPTMAPLFMSYVKPVLSRISGRSTDRVHLHDSPRMVQTIGGSGPPSDKRAGSYQSSVTYGSQEDVMNDFVVPGHGAVAKLRTDCSRSPRVEGQQPPGSGGIYVQQQFHSTGI